jgi:hypothetical protein
MRISKETFNNSECAKKTKMKEFNVHILYTYLNILNWLLGVFGVSM